MSILRYFLSMYHRLFSKLFFLITVTLLSSCATQKRENVSITQINVSLFIAMPQSAFTFENIAPHVYTDLVKHFRRMGCVITNSAAASEYSLETTIDSLAPARRYISPDVLLFSSVLKLELTCKLYDQAGKLASEKKFMTSTISSKAKNPTLNSSFLLFEYKKLLRNVMPQIGLYFRSYL